MTEAELKSVLAAHMAWLRGGSRGKRANLSGANLFKTNLTGADLTGADLTGANLTGANLTGSIPIYADTKRRYVLYCLPEVLGGPRFIAGCRNFTRAEAIAHWKDSQPAYVEAIERYMQAS